MGSEDAAGGSREPARAPLTPAERAEIRQLLDRADRAITEDHLTYPASGSALTLLDRVLLLDPDNTDANRGLERVVERYLALALMAAERRQFAQAHGMLDRSRLVDPTHPGIAPTEAQLQMLADADRRVIELNGEQLRDRNSAIVETLRQAGLASRRAACETLPPDSARAARTQRRSNSWRAATSPPCAATSATVGRWGSPTRFWRSDSTPSSRRRSKRSG